MSDNERQSRDYALLASQPDAQCLVCTRPFTLDTEVTNSFEALAICRECKTTVLNDSERDVTTSTYQRRRQRRRRSRKSSGATGGESQPDRGHFDDDLGGSVGAGASAASSGARVAPSPAPRPQVGEKGSMLLQPRPPPTEADTSPPSPEAHFVLSSARRPRLPREGSAEADPAPELASGSGPRVTYTADAPTPQAGGPVVQVSGAANAVVQQAFGDAGDATPQVTVCADTPVVQPSEGSSSAPPLRAAGRLTLSSLAGGESEASFFREITSRISVEDLSDVFAGLSPRQICEVSSSALLKGLLATQRMSSLQQSLEERSLWLREAEGKAREREDQLREAEKRAKEGEDSVVELIKKLAISEKTVRGLRTNLATEQARVTELTDRESKHATHLQDVLRFAQSVCQAIDELGEVLDLRPEPFVADPTGDEACRRLAWAASACNAIRDAVSPFGQTCAQAATEMSLSCLHLAGCNVRGILSLANYVPPSDAQIGAAREEIEEDSRAFLSRVWSRRRAGMQYTKALWEYAFAVDAPSDDDAAGDNSHGGDEM